jgi:hypothetical protein
VHPLIAALYAALVQFTAGSLLVVWLSDRGGIVTPGFRRLGMVIVVPIAILLWSVSGSAPHLEQWLAVALLALVVCYTLLQFGGRANWRTTVGMVATSLALIGVAVAGWGRPSSALGPLWTTVVAVASMLATGGGVMAMVLGHWYLMTPKLSEAPLRQLCDLTLAGLAVLSVFTVWFVLAHPVAATVGPEHWLLRWGGVFGITLLPLGVTLAARFCCDQAPRGRALQAATGLLYVTSALVLAGVLGGNMVLLSAGQ